MIPWTLLDTAVIPGDGGEMRLYQRGDEYSIRVGPYELMNSRVHASEDALAELVCERMGGSNRRVLIGGLGMGFTLTAVLQRIDAKSEAIVAELVPAVVAWHRGPLRGVSKGALDDRRVTIREEDVARVIADGAYDAILLDVDNGPAGLTSKHNDRLYTHGGLRRAYDALRPKGILAVWSGGPDDAFVKRLRQTGFTVEEVKVRGRGAKGGPRYVIWLASRP
ncbi:MAG TPA: spermidine synthase [Thermoanaerobaculia bacterium]|nr:spermidine synthase [Thermoanaerobaculia bacterium]